MTAAPRISICFVCMGNICRSPIAENVFRHKAKQRGVEHLFEIDSAGTGGWHTGEPPDPRARQAVVSRGIAMTGTARQINHDDFQRFHWLVCMDSDNRSHLLAMGAPEHQVRLLLECDPNAACREVPDPYYGGADGFETVFHLVDSACNALMDELLSTKR